jgi:hypothetical protein
MAAARVVRFGVALNLRHRDRASDARTMRPQVPQLTRSAAQRTMQIHGVRDDQVQRGKRESSVPALSHENFLHGSLPHFT